MKKIIIPIVLLIGICMNVFAQEKSHKEVKGDKYYTIYAFDRAINSYKHDKKLSVDGQRKLAASYHNINMNTEAEAAYLKLINNASGLIAEDYFNYAMVLKTNNKYELANTAMSKFNEMKPADLRAQDFMAHNTELSNLLLDDGKYKIVHLDMNSDASDFGTSFMNDKIVYSSTKNRPRWVKRIDNWTRKSFLDLYIADVNNGQFKNVKEFNKCMNTKLHDGTASFNKNATYMAYSTDKKGAKRKQHFVNLEIYFSNFKDGKWSKPEAFYLNNNDYSVGQPCLSADGNTMYFTSDMPGGFGGADIYRATKNAGGAWGAAENLGNKINTEGNEMFPFIKEDNTLYFASNGRFGLGGLDVFVAHVSGAAFENVHNAGYPLNTRYDDFAVIANEANKGYFSSNRENGSGSDDIYAVDILKVEKFDKQIDGVAKDQDGLPIPLATIILNDENGEPVNTVTTNDQGSFKLKAGSNKNFIIVGKKDDYTDGITKVNSFGKEPIPVTVTLQKKVVVIAKPVEPKMEVGTDIAKVVNFDPDKIYFDYDKYVIRPDAKVELNKIIRIMNEHPTMVVELGAYTDCRGNDEYNKVLSDKRAKVTADYIKKEITKPERIYGTGYGESNLINDCACKGKDVSGCSEKEQQQNRRTEFIIKHQ